MDERETTAKGRRRKPENPLMQQDRQKSQRKPDPEKKERTASGRTAENTGGEYRKEDMPKKDVYKLRILTIILVLLILALIGAFVSEIGIYGNQGGKTQESAASAYEAVLGTRV